MRNVSEEEFNSGFTRAVIRRPSFAVGDRVFIHDRSHPAGGETGRITTAPREVNGIVTGIWAEVAIDGWAGHECGVQPHQMRKLS